MLLMAIADIRQLLTTADITAALSVEALLGTDQVFLPELHAALRPHPGQAASADNMLRVLSNSPIVASHRINDTKVQDAYSLRCAPQVAGAVRDTVDHAALVASRELAAAIDNPVVLPDGRVSSNGNFHGAPVAYVLDFLAIAVADLSSIAERRTDRMLDPARSHGLPAFLAADPGVDSGLMIAQYTQAGLVSDNKRLAVPASVDSIPSSAMQEDHVSMGWHAARKLRRAVENLRRVLAIELVTSARALDIRTQLSGGELTPGPAGAAVIAALRDVVDGPGTDRFLSPELEAADRPGGLGQGPGGGRIRRRKSRLREKQNAAAAEQFPAPPKYSGDTAGGGPGTVVQMESPHQRSCGKEHIQRGRSSMKARGTVMSRRLASASHGFRLEEPPGRRPGRNPQARTGFGGR